MRSTTLSLMIAMLVLSACAGLRESRVNPANWFGSSRAEPAAPTPASTNPLIPERTGIFAARRAEQAIYRGTPIETVSDLSVERVPGGAILRTTGIAAVQGVYDVQLTPANEDELAEDGVLTYRLEGLRPASAVRGGPVQTRRVIAARKLTDSVLAGVRTIRVEGLSGARSVRR